MDEMTRPSPRRRETEEPIPFALTVRARREIAPEQLPDLRVVTERDSGDLDRRGDPRPAQARALRRSGLSAATIAGRLTVDELVVRAWIADTTVTRRQRGRSSSADLPDPRCTPDVIAGEPASGSEPGVSLEEDEVVRGLGRAAAHADALERLATDARFAATVGFLTGIAEVEPNALACTTRRPQLAANLLERLRGELDLQPQSIRVVLRIGPAVAGDLARHHWSHTLDLPLERFVHTRWSAAETPDAVEAMLRITDEDIAATVAGWCDAFLDPTSVALDLAF